jgi:hypothetical protein
VSLSSAESELVALSQASVEGLAVGNLLAECGLGSSIQVLSDSVAALAVNNRLGPGRLKHLRLKLLWMQQQRSEGSIEYARVSGRSNFSDLMTKEMPVARFRLLRHLCGVALNENEVLSTGARYLELQDDPMNLDLLVEAETSSTMTAEPWSWTMTVIMMTNVVMCGCGFVQLVHWIEDGFRHAGCCTRRASRTVATQSPTTYTSLRGQANPRFQPIEGGVWTQ